MVRWRVNEGYAKVTENSVEINIVEESKDGKKEKADGKKMREIEEWIKEEFLTLRTCRGEEEELPTPGKNNHDFYSNFLCKNRYSNRILYPL